MGLKVVMLNRPDSRSCPGGDTVQMNATADFLRACGHDVDISCDIRPGLAGYDVAHLFNLTRPYETAAQAERVRRSNLPYVLSSVYWDLESAIPWRAFEFPRNLYRLFTTPSIRRNVRGCLSKLRSSGDQIGASKPLGAESDQDPRQLQAVVVQHAAWVFPNSEAEKTLLLKMFPEAAPNRFCVTPNGIELPQASSSTLAVEDNASFVCAGAIGPRKNQLRLVKAFRSLPQERLLVIGQSSPGSARYERAMRRAAGPNVEFRSPVPHEEMNALLMSAKALVQPSYIETPGLAAMEAAAVGTPIVVADVAPVREYFGDLPCYCNPASTSSIARACRDAATSRRSNGEAFAEAHCWEKALAPMAKAYAAMEEDLRR